MIITTGSMWANAQRGLRGASERLIEGRLLRLAPDLSRRLDLLSNDSAFVSPTLSATCATSAVPARDTKPAPSDVTSAVTGRPSRITFKVNLQARIGTFDEPKDPCSVGRFRAPARRGRGRYCTLRANRR